MSARKIGIVAVVGVLLSCLPRGARAAEKRAELPDLLLNPILGISYDPARIHYEAVPPSLRKLCPNDFAPKNEWIYAHVRSGSADYYVTTSYNPHADSDMMPSFILVDGGACTHGDLTWSHAGVPPTGPYAKTRIVERLPGRGATEVSDSGGSHYILRSAHEEWVLRQLDKDALRRGIAAYRSKAVLKHLFCDIEEKMGFPRFPFVIDEQEYKAFCSGRRTQKKP